MLLSVIISQRNDPLGSLITIRDLLKKLPEDTEIVLIDNSDDLTIFPSMISHQYIREGRLKILTSQPSLFIAREKGIREAKGRWILFLDSHMLLGYYAIEAFLRAGDMFGGSLGFLYGPCAYHYGGEDDEFVDRNLVNLAGMSRTKARLKLSQGIARITFRGVPMMCEKAHFMRIGGYGALAKHGMPWGGGDYLLGLKTRMLGYENYLVDGALGIHLGPFSGLGSQGFVETYMKLPPPTDWPPYIGMLTAAYICGGKPLLEERALQVRRRLGNRQPQVASNAVKLKASRLGEQDRKWLLENKKFSYEEIVRKFGYHEEKK